MGGQWEHWLGIVVYTQTLPLVCGLENKLWASVQHVVLGLLLGPSMRFFLPHSANSSVGPYCLNPGLCLKMLR